MILHQQILQPESGPLNPWFAVHCESLTIARCAQTSSLRISITAMAHDREPCAIASPLILHPFSAEEIAVEILRVLNFKSTISNPQSPIPATPEYLLLNSLDGGSPAVMHTADPVFIAFVDPATATLRAPEHYRSSVDLSAEGWAYWWEDAQRAFERLTVEAVAACGIEVPEEIRRQV